MKIPVVNRTDYTMYLEVFNNLYWLHTDVYKWSSKIKKEYIKELDQLQSLLNSPLYGVVNNNKLGKFGKVLGFSFLKSVTGIDNLSYQIYVRSL